jgi:hypothetical protein
MPNWQPNWTDVQFDYPDAYETISICCGCIAFLEGRDQVLGPARERAKNEWRGRYREEFDRETSYLERVAGDVVEQLRASIRGVTEEIAAAEVEQRLRMAERFRWEDEARAEHARGEQNSPTAGSGTPGWNGAIALS